MLRQLQGHNVFHPSSVIIINKSDFPFNPTRLANLYDNLRMIYDLLWCALFLLLWLSAGNMFFNFNHEFVFPHEKRLVLVQFGRRRNGTGFKDVWQRKLHKTNKQKITIKYFTTPWIHYIYYWRNRSRLSLCNVQKRISIPSQYAQQRSIRPRPRMKEQNEIILL